MKKALVSVVRFFVFTWALLLVLLLNRGPQAPSGGGNCQTFNTITLDCPSCCSNPPTTFAKMVVTSSGAGTQTIQDNSYPFGTAAAGCYTPCSGTYPPGVTGSSSCKAQGS